jgi:carboxymethylenebutenolidase
MIRFPRFAYLLAMMSALSCDAAARAPNHGVDFKGAAGSGPIAGKDEVQFQSGKRTLHGVVYMPRGKGPFPTVLWNHGSWKDPMVAFDQLAPVFAERGWIFFGPFRRGHGLSSSAGPSIMDEITEAGWGTGNRAAKAARLLTGEHLDDQLAAYTWLRTRPYVLADRIAVAGNSFGGILTVLGAERVPYCAAINGAGASQSWSKAPELRDIMVRAARASKAPMFLFQAENDFDLTPTRVVSAAMREAGKVAEARIYPPFGDTSEDGHSFAWRGGGIWASDVLVFMDRHCRVER